MRARGPCGWGAKARVRSLITIMKRRFGLLGDACGELEAGRPACAPAGGDVRRGGTAAATAIAIARTSSSAIRGI